MKRLYRTTHNQQVAGVCAGLAEYLNVDVTLVRLIFVILTLAGGPGLILYIALWFIVPEDVELQQPRKRKNIEEYEEV